jgi:hypothetical protein
MKYSDKSIQILQLTKDGDSLAPQDLRLVELAVNGGLSEAGIAAFGKLYEMVLSGTYATMHQWLCGIEHLTRDADGYVYWKGRRAEHYSFSDNGREADAAHRLAARCTGLDAVGIPVSMRTATQADCYTAPVGTPWIVALQRYYSFFCQGDQVVGIFYRLHMKADEPQVVAAYKDAQGIHLSLYPGAYEAYHALAGQGLTSAGIPQTYGETDSLLTRTGLSGAELEKIIDATM